MSRTITEPADQGETLRREHLSLDRRCADLSNRAQSGDWRECDAIWDDFCRQLEAHMRYEETCLLPDYAQQGEREALVALKLRGEHGDVRRLVDRLGVALQVHSLRAYDIEDLVALLGRHVSLENETLYPWAKRASSAVDPTAPHPLAGRSEHD
ncbi:MAG: hemerythrin domain-containing protein [Polyangiaceae bacterium]|jgi:hypothetical protein|nr:hemerythrin domain-containing protein [Polyangiaceae bacterium]